ncbi:7TM diverse intracellular signalling [Paenibacillus sp. 1_12]|uniref:ATP-binding protein n=1 Tax=Paenibacillus sp. 1_12 TaxID=1566278 RepID=UPI0008E1CFFE|nr:ATP-binding protein [Paenibacillus sp. 1_12]SFM28953.1 7TM diverse intracellular signalling [Paenibacillus sp. 1_12]
MKRSYYRKAIGIGLIFSFFIILLAGIYSQTMPGWNAPLVKKGMLDLSNWDLHKQGWVSLNGQWEFYEGELLEPTDFRDRTLAEVSYLSVPGTWKGKTASGGMYRKGYGTYRLKVLVKDTDEVLGLKIKSIRISNRLYINGKLVGESGRPATVEEANKPGNSPYIASFHADAKEVEIVIQVSNYEFVTGGIVNSIPFGLDRDMTKLDGIQLGADLGIIFLLGMFGAYHLCFYLLGRGEKTYLLSGTYLLLLMLEKALYGEKLLQRLLPDLSFFIAYKLLDLSEFISAVVIILFFCSVEARLMSVRTMKWILAPLALYITGVIALPYRIHINIKYVFFLYLFFVILYIIARMVYLCVRSQGGSSDRKELMLFIGGSISLMIFLVDGSLYSENAVPTDLAGKIGVIGFIIFMNILLAIRFSNAYEKAEILTKQLAVANERKDEFLLHTSHELKTPLHGILNLASHLLDDEENHLTSKQKQNLWLIKDTSIKLSMLIHDLLDVSRLKHGELLLHPTVVDVKVVAQIVFDVQRFELLGKSVKLDNQVCPDVWVQADENRLRQIVYNLISNAIKHTDKGSIKVMSSVELNTVTISVMDTGTGIPKDKHAVIFEYYEQLDEPLPKDGYTGMGVGLYISRKLVEQMGGEIWVDWSEVGQGTRMSFTLPAAVQAPTNRETAHTLEEQQRNDSNDQKLDIWQGHDNTVMIVDDEASNIHTLLNILERQPYNVITAFSAKEALDKIEAYPQIDLVILDVMMPGISGIELCQRLRSNHSIIDLPILFATVKDTPQDIALGFRAGANDYLTKPFDAETLLARIHTLIAVKTSLQDAIRHEQAFYQAQIKPHFLYNALSSVISFCYTDGEKAAYLLSMLSQYLRYILDMDRSTIFVPLYREMELIQAYVEIEKARFGERFEYDFYCDEGIEYVEIPSLCIQPLVENAIRHGLFEKEGQGKVTLSINEVDDYIRVVVEDDGIGIPVDRLHHLSQGERRDFGIGIYNIRKRLDALPGTSLTISSEMGHGTQITMYLPVKSYRNKTEEG